MSELPMIKSLPGYPWLPEEAEAARRDKARIAELEVENKRLVDAYARKAILAAAREDRIDKLEAQKQATWDKLVLEREIFSELKEAAVLAEREAVARWMIANSYATGHGDTIPDLLAELERQIPDRRARPAP